MAGLFKLAAVQAEPEWFDVDAGIEKAVKYIEEAGCAGQQANFIAFGECWLGGYPFYIWAGTPAFAIQFHAAFIQKASLDPDDKTDAARIQRLRDAARDNKINLVMGFNLRKGGSVWAAQMMIDSAGEIRFVRRKLKPTHAERTVYAEGDGSDFVVEDVIGLGRVGALNCWENLIPQNKLVMYGLQEEIHVAGWPAFVVYNEVAYGLSAEANMAVSKVYALEGSCYVLAATAIVTKKYRAALQMVVDQLQEAHAARLAPPVITLDMVPFDLCLTTGGGSASIYGPDGRTLVQSLDANQEEIVYATGSKMAILACKATMDPVGHYSRPDVHTLRWNGRKNAGVESSAEQDARGAPEDVEHISGTE